MEISFCDRCHESVPDADLESGKAVRIGGKVLHIPCAFRRAMPGAGRTILALLTLAALGGATFAVVRLLDRDRNAGLRSELSTLWRADDATAMKRFEEGQRVALVAERAELQRQIDAGFARIADAAATQSTATAEARATVEGRLAAYREQVDASQKRLDEVDRRLEKISAWVEDVRNLAARSSAGASVPPPSAPVAPPAAVPPPSVEPAPRTPAVDPKVAAERDAELKKWVEKLKDPDPSTSFSATYKLKDLKDLRATGPLIETLRTNRDYYTRLGAASALMEFKACDAVPALMDALDDKEELVQTAAADALLVITGHDAKWVPALTKKEKKAKRDEWAKFWKENESTVRSRLGQEARPEAPK